MFFPKKRIFERKKDKDTCTHPEGDSNPKPFDSNGTRSTTTLPRHLACVRDKINLLHRSYVTSPFLFSRWRPLFCEVKSYIVRFLTLRFLSKNQNYLSKFVLLKITLHQPCSFSSNARKKIPSENFPPRLSTIASHEVTTT